MRLIFAIILSVFLNWPAFAQCNSPSGTESQTRYSGNKLYYCGNGSWHEVPGSSGGGSGAGCVVGSVYVPGGYTHTFFSASSHANCASIGQSRTCTNGVLSGSGTYAEPFCSNAADTTPDAFSFNDVTGAPLNTLTTPTPIGVTITGISAPTPISVSGQGSPQINIGGAGWVTSGTITNGQDLLVRLTSANANDTPYVATIDIGGVTDNWSVATLGSDTTPDAFSFNDVTNAPTSTLTTPTPATVTVSGINTSTSVSVSGQGTPQISINGGAWTTSGIITNGQTLAVRLTSAAANNTAYAATIDVGGVTDGWSVTTEADPCTTGPIGTVCTSDGAKYIGAISGARIYARSTDSSSSIRHKNSNSNTTGTDGTTNGSTNTDAMISAGSHPIATTCRAHGPQWYVPARNELTLFWTNRATLNLSSMGLNTSGSYYWSSSQDGSPDAWARRFNDGSEGDDFKKDNLCRLRCVRR